MKLFHLIIKFILDLFFEDEQQPMPNVAVVVSAPLVFHEVNTKVRARKAIRCNQEYKQVVENHIKDWREFKKYNATVNHYFTNKEVIP